MIDCRLTEIGAIRSIFGDAVQVLICHWHIKRAWESHIKKDEDSFHTNNLIESYHNQIKSFYLGRSRNLRVDHMLYLLTKVILVDYRQDSIITYYGFQDAKLTAFEEKKRAKAYEINFDIACSMIEKIDEDNFSCDSFTGDGKYIVEVVDNCISACSCPNTTKICKHIFLTSRITQIPFSLCFSLFEPLSDDLPDVEDSCDVDEAENLRLAEYFENIQRYHNSFNSIYQ
ncbi:hypothetical protein G6F43_005510 [Rhizopus delemar]|nr:hypothetical protein G6F43_005510 [Rhizopus delemar]